MSPDPLMSPIRSRAPVRDEWGGDPRRAVNGGEIPGGAVNGGRSPPPFHPQFEALRRLARKRINPIEKPIRTFLMRLFGPPGGPIGPPAEPKGAQAAQPFLDSRETRCEATLSSTAIPRLRFLISARQNSKNRTFHYISQLVWRTGRGKGGKGGEWVS